jgi:hypothetical protein
MSLQGLLGFHVMPCQSTLDIDAMCDRLKVIWIDTESIATGMV